MLVVSIVARKVCEGQQIQLAFKGVLLVIWNGGWQLVTGYASALVMDDEKLQK